MGTLVGRISYLLKRIRPAADKTCGATAARPRPAPSRKRSLRFISCMASSVSDSQLLFICPRDVQELCLPQIAWVARFKQNRHRSRTKALPADPPVDESGSIDAQCARNEKLRD